MIDIIIELATNLYQSFLFLGFLYFFFQKGENKKKNLIAFFSFAILMFAAFTYFTFNTDYMNNLSTYICILIMEVYTIIFLKGNMFIKIIMPLFSFLINTVISYGVGYIISYISGYSYKELVMQSSLYRYLCIFIINFINFCVYLLIVKIRSKSLSLSKWTDIVSFIVIPIILMLIIYSTLIILHYTGYSSGVLMYLIIICLSMTAVTVIVWIMMERISKDNEIKIRFLLTQQREHMYEANILQMNTQIENMSKIKHDIKNNLLCIDELISKGEFEEAEKFCRELSDRSSAVYTPVNTGNSLLNAVINVEMEKALNCDIKFSVNIGDELTDFSENSDIVSIIGNICDNAIEYLQKCPKDMREMELDIYRRKNYNVIICKNKIYVSVLNENPDLVTNKKDKSIHGKGMEIVRDYTQKYGGDIKYHEKNGYLYVSAILKVQSLPEK